MTSSPLGVAVIGYGWMGRLHAQAYLRLRHHYPQLPAARLIGVADPEAERRDEAVSRFGQRPGPGGHDAVGPDRPLDAGRFR